VKYKFAQRLQMTGGRLHVQHPEWCLEMEDTMSQSKDNTAADLHIYTAHAHDAAAAAHHRGDHEAAEELRSRAQDYSMATSEKTIEIAKQSHVPMRA